jgi:hypothetical protein
MIKIGLLQFFLEKNYRESSEAKSKIPISSRICPRILFFAFDFTNFEPEFFFDIFFPSDKDKKN